MQKIISLFQRNYETDRLVRDEITPGAEWVINGEGIATRKWDGTCCMIKDGQLYKRYDAKKGKAPPVGFIPAQEPDPVTGHWPGWVEVKADAKEDRWHLAAFTNTHFDSLIKDGTYELVGPKINSNKEGFDDHFLIKHAECIITNVPRSFTGLKKFFEQVHIEGIVWHHDDGRMCKIKKKDFGYKW